ncbi:Rrf2 family transcriptional regulator [Patescibacteria group bacterium]|nr:Rrf2 family transcriptional regulator [Patescibacteria group bacterium]MBU1721815.1 Rrf2 family transcriptional regulator [Patescibacteria group bacterium]MBU1901691.1 Rrf2 family transcriptional regulator [Patescibacteria group bacterium]
MICLNKQVDYGVQFLVALSLVAPKEQLSLRQFTEKHNMSFLFLQRIASLLKKAKLIQATKGAHGGYSLVKDPKDITFLEIYEAIEGPYGPTSCLRDPAFDCPREKLCASQDFFMVLQHDLRDFMQKSTLDTIITLYVSNKTDR